MDHRLKDERGLSSLAVAADWQEWWREWGPKIAARHGKQAWILFLLDANEKLQEVSMLISRIMRNKPKWESTGWTQAEWENVETHCNEAAAWYERNVDFPLRDAPEWAQFLFTAQGGNFAVLRRLGRELRALQEQGYLVATIERRPGVGLEFGADAKEVITREAD